MDNEKQGSAPLQLYLEGGIPVMEGNAALVLFCGIVVWATRGTL